MGGGLMQLVAYGAQDIYLTGNPQITFFKVVYRRHTNFAVESIEQTFSGSASSKVSVTVSRNGDLLSRVWVQGLTSFSNIDYVECEIGGQVIDKQYGDWMTMWTDLTHNLDSRALLNACATAEMLPLQFWFCRNPGLALPLIALQYHEVKLNIAVNSGSTLDKVWCDYIFLDTDERRRFAQVSHEYLIEQTQFSNTLSVAESSSNQHELRFNHPVKELMWRLNGNTNQADNVVLQLNGHDRFKTRPASYFSAVQRYQHHSGCGGLQTSAANTAGDETVAVPSNIQVYSFALKPEEHQPSGTCNFSRIDNAVLNYDAPAGASSIEVYAVNYNVLRVMSGMGGLAYSN
jgi:hypothetical protein